MKVIIGLGNFGREFDNTYHNAGFMVVDKVLQELNLTKSKEMCSGVVYETNVGGEKIYFVKPTTYMNNSGICVASVLGKLKCTMADLLVVVDDIDLDAGHVRIRKKGSAGTHNGLRSIVAYCGTEFARVRIGCGRPHQNQDLADFVLSKAPASSDFYKAIEIGAKAVLEYVQGSTLDKVMQNYNG